MTERLLPVPDGLAGERLDVALTRLLGLSRSRAVDLIADGAVPPAPGPWRRGGGLPLVT